MIKLVILSLLVLGCVRTAPVAPTPRLNPVCAMIVFSAPSAKCSDADDAQHEHGIVRVEIDVGVKYCWPTYDKNGYGCATFALSKSETAQVAVQEERERAKREADAKAKAEADKPKPAETTKPEPTKAPVPPLAHTTIPTGKK